MGILSALRGLELAKGIIRDYAEVSARDVGREWRSISEMLRTGCD